MRKSAEPAPSAVKQAPQVTAVEFSSAFEVWPSFKEELEKNYPFLYEGITSASPSFTSKTEWEFSFREKDAFFKDTLQRRIKDLEAAALKVCGQKISFTFKVTKCKIPAVFLKNNTAAATKSVPAKQKTADKTVLSAENHL